MLQRNIVEIVILILVLILIAVIYSYAKKKVADLESDLTIVYKSDLVGKLEEVDNIE